MKILAWIIGVPIAIIALWGVGRLLFCGPDKSIQKVTDPMATAILEYINTHGRPESLADIPNLPYKVEECKKLAGEDKEKCTYLGNGTMFALNINYDCLTDNGLIGCHAIAISNTSKNTIVFYYVKESNKYKRKLEFSFIRFDTIHDSFLCKNGILKMA